MLSPSLKSKLAEGLGRLREGEIPRSLSQEERQHLHQTLQSRNSAMAVLLGWVILVGTVVFVFIDLERWRLGQLAESPLYRGLLVLHLMLALAGVLSAALATPAVRARPDLAARVLGTQMTLTLASMLAMGVLAIVERGTLVMLAIAMWLLHMGYPRVPRALRLGASLLVMVAGLAATWALVDGRLVAFLPRFGELCTVVLLGAVVGNALTRGRIQQIVGDYREARRSAQLQRDVDVAASLQQALLPRHWPADQRFELFALMRPAKDIGGDFYDHFPCGGGRIGLVVADVSGKGVTAGLFSMVAKTRLRSLAQNASLSPQDVMLGLNEELCEGNEENLFITALYAQYDPALGRLEFVNAGHPPPLLLSAQGEVTPVQGVRSGLPLGVMAGMPYEQDSLVLKPGEAVLLYTDGITEATDPALAEFGTQGLLGLFAGQSPPNAREAVDRILEAVTAHAQGRQAADDVTCMMLRRPPQTAAAAFPSRPIRFVVPSEPGTSPDRVARVLSGFASTRLGQPIVVENMPEDFGMQACRQVVAATPDGHTVLALLSAVAFKTALSPTTSIRPERELSAVALLAGGPNILVVHASAPADNLDELLSWARSSAQPLVCASGGSMTSQHVSGMLLAMVGRVELRLEIFANTLESLNAVVDGRASMAFINVPMALSHIRAGRVKALGVSVDESLPALPGLAPLSNRLQGFNVSAWFGLAAPAGTPDEVVQRLHAAFREAQAQDQAQATFQELGLQAQSGSPEDFAALVRSEISIWEGVMRAAQSVAR